MVRTLTSYCAARLLALRVRGATARRSSTIAYSRSVRFTSRTVGPTPDNAVNEGDRRRRVDHQDRIEQLRAEVPPWSAMTTCPAPCGAKRGAMSQVSAPVQPNPSRWAVERLAPAWNLLWNTTKLVPIFDEALRRLGR